MKDNFISVFICAYFLPERICEVIKDNTIRLYITKVTHNDESSSYIILSALLMGTVFDAQSLEGPCGKESGYQSARLKCSSVWKSIMRKK